MINLRNDYSEGAHPKVLQALSEINTESNAGYGADPHCALAADLIRAQCECPQAAVHFFIGGTSANFTTIAATLRPHEAVIAADTGHINVHEGGAVEGTGHKILPCPSRDGKVTPVDVERWVELSADTAMALPRMVYISNATEVGTIYSKTELEALSACCRAHGLYLFLDGARLGTGLTAPGADLTLPDLARLCDAFYIGGTKNGALMGEAMVLPNPDLQPHFFRVMKQKGAVLAKGFLLGVQFEALLKGSLYWENACWANCMAAKLRNGLTEMGFSFYTDSPTNQIFPIIPDSLMPAIELLCSHEVWCKGENDCTVIRLVTSFVTKERDVDEFLAQLKALRLCLEEKGTL
jgi:threonine aldolase